jgi:hypothetical protein
VWSGVDVLHIVDLMSGEYGVCSNREASVFGPGINR